LFSPDEAGKAREDAKPMLRGINSLQLYHDGARWWVSSLV
jgi:hypothetical protein